MKGHDFVVHFAAESHVDRSIDDASGSINSMSAPFNPLRISVLN